MTTKERKKQAMKINSTNTNKIRPRPTAMILPVLLGFLAVCLPVVAYEVDRALYADDTASYAAAYAADAAAQRATIASRDAARGGR